MVSEAETHRLIAGKVCLDFANTVNGHLRDNPHEYLKNYRDLVLWSRHARILSPHEERVLVREAERHPTQAARAYTQAIKLRETIYRLFTARAQGTQPLDEDFQALNRARSQALARSRIVRTQDGYAWDWTDDTALDRPLLPIVLSAADLLIDGNLARVRACGGEGCDWLFVDNSRNHLRRWCSMDECGNRAKAKRFQERKRRHPAGPVLQRRSGSSADS
jgi:predicted RNA-binding Zn ribbon-like protein